MTLLFKNVVMIQRSFLNGLQDLYCKPELLLCRVFFFGGGGEPLWNFLIQMNYE